MSRLAAKCSENLETSCITKSSQTLWLAGVVSLSIKKNCYFSALFLFRFWVLKKNLISFLAHLVLKKNLLTVGPKPGIFAALVVLVKKPAVMRL